MATKLQENEAIEQQDDTYDTSNKEEVNKVRKKSARKKADRLLFVQAAMDTEQGRAWFYDLLLRCHVFNTPFDDDPYRHAYRAGEANIGLMVLGDIQEVSDANYIKMVQENKTTRNG